MNSELDKCINNPSYFYKKYHNEDIEFSEKEKEAIKNLALSRFKRKKSLNNFFGLL